MVRNLAMALKARGRTLVVISLYNLHTPLCEDLEGAEIDVVYLNKRAGLDTRMVGRLASVFRQRSVDVVHTHLPILKYSVPAVGRVKRDIRMLHTFHSVAQWESGSKIVRAQNRRFLRDKDVLPVAISSEVQQSIAAVYGIDAACIPVVHNGVDLAAFQGAPRRPHANVELLHVGRFDHVKNHMFLLQVYIALKRRHPEIGLTLVGDGPLMPAVRDHVRSNSITGVRFAGHVANTATFYRESDIFVLPSLQEGSPLSVIEAMAAGLPVVVSRVGGLPSLVIDGENGFVCDLRVEAFAAGIERLIRDKPAREAFGMRSSALAQAYSSEAMAAGYEHVYDR